MSLHCIPCPGLDPDCDYTCRRCGYKVQTLGAEHSDHAICEVCYINITLSDGSDITCPPTKCPYCDVRLFYVRWLFNVGKQKWVEGDGWVKTSE